jgi:hypothetical protein
MRKAFLPVLMASTLILLVSLLLLYSVIFFFPQMMEEYYNPVFRSNSFSTDILFYLHPFVLSVSLYWYWDRFKTAFTGSKIGRVFSTSMAYTIMAILPVLWITFSAINISFFMVITWLIYGAVQTFAAIFVFARFNP